MHQRGAGGSCDVSPEFPGQLVQEICIRGTQSELPLCSQSSSFGDMVHNPGQFACREVGIQGQPRPVHDFFSSPVAIKALDHIACAIVLPDNHG